MSATNIEWADEVWNFARGCTRISPGCMRCYAERQAIRQSAEGKPYHGLVKSTPAGPRWTGSVAFDPLTLLAPLSWARPRMVFVNSMSDLFHDGLSFEQIAAAFGVMAAAPDHTFQILTKRPERMLEFFAWAAKEDRVGGGVNTCVASMYGVEEVNTHLTRNDERGNACLGEGEYDYLITDPPEWPLSNVWLGVSVEDQANADARIPLLLQTPAAVRWVSYEPALGPVFFTSIPRVSSGEIASALRDRYELLQRKPVVDGARLDWIVVGGESGPGARPFDLAWARLILQQCAAAKVPVFMKQVGAVPLVPAWRQTHWDYKDAFGGTATFKEFDADRWRMVLKDRKGGNPEEWPEWARVREFPAADGGR